MTLHLTPTEQRIMDRLADGQSHPIESLRSCLNDELCEPNVLSVHMTYLRRKLRRIGEDIICELGKVRCYRHVRLLANPYKE